MLTETLDVLNLLGLLLASSWRWMWVYLGGSAWEVELRMLADAVCKNMADHLVTGHRILSFHPPLQSSLPHPVRLLVHSLPARRPSQIPSHPPFDSPFLISLTLTSETVKIVLNLDYCHQPAGPNSPSTKLRITPDPQTNVALDTKFRTNELAAGSNQINPRLRLAIPTISPSSSSHPSTKSLTADSLKWCAYWASRRRLEHTRAAPANDKELQESSSWRVSKTGLQARANRLSLAHSPSEQHVMCAQ